MTDHTIYEYIPHLRTQTKIGDPPPVPSGSLSSFLTGMQPLGQRLVRSQGTQRCGNHVVRLRQSSGRMCFADAADKRSETTYMDAGAVLHESVKLHEHLMAQDAVLTSMVDRLAGVEARVA
jgi:hypothetical protein